MKCSLNAAIVIAPRREGTGSCLPDQLLPAAILSHHLAADLQDGVLANQRRHAPPDSLSDVGLQHGGGASERFGVEGKLITGNEAVGSDFDESTEGLFAHGQIHSEAHAVEARGRERGEECRGSL